MPALIYRPTRFLRRARILVTQAKHQRRVLTTCGTTAKTDGPQ
jgi:hypothetical protein